jgi:hypothetical protein
VQASPGKISTPTNVIRETIKRVIRPRRILLITKKNIFRIVYRKKNYLKDEKILQALIKACKTIFFINLP